MISIIVTAYNLEKYILTCLLSIKNQSYDNYEVIIVDDGSTDNTKQICQHFCETDGRFSYYHQSNSGVSVARNNGICLAKGSFIMFVDGDDYLDKDTLSFFNNNITSNVDIVCSCCYAFLDDNYKEDHFFDNSYYMSTTTQKERLFLQLLNGNIGKPDGKGFTAIGVPWGKVYRLSFIKKFDLKFDPELLRMQDNMFNLYAFYYANSVYYIDEPHYNYRLNNIANTKGYKPEIWLKLLSARNVFWDKHPDLLIGQIKKASIYEKYVAFAGSLLYLSKNEKLCLAKKQAKLLSKNEMYAELFCKNNNHFIPFKLRIISYLIKLHLYSFVLLVLRLL